MAKSNFVSIGVIITAANVPERTVHSVNEATTV